MLSTKESEKNNEVQRWLYDLDMCSHVDGNIGGLQTLARYYTLPGDSFELNAKFQFKLSPLVRSLPQDAVIDLFAFWVPHRHVYGSDWITWLKSGYDEATTLGVHTTGAATSIACVGRTIYPSTNIPKHILTGYSRIWNRYFKHPSDADIADDYLLTTSGQERAYGIACCWPKTIWNTGMPNNLTSADDQYTVSGGQLDLPDFALQQARLKTELDRDWFSIRYNDILENNFGGSADIDADQRPDLLMRSTQFISGWDVENTDTAAVGSYTGRAAGVAEIVVPRRYIPEHGVIWIMGLVRFRPTVMTEGHYLDQASRAELSYLSASGDPEIIQNSEPIAVTAADFFIDGSAGVSLNRIPYGQWFRTQPDYVHQDFAGLTGFPFKTGAPSSTAQGYYIDYLAYNDCFSNQNLRHWHCNGYIDANAFRCVPPPKASIYAGTRK